MQTSAHFILAALATLLCLGVDRARCETIIDDNFHFSITTPTGFQRDPRLTASNPNVIYGFRSDPGVIILERMHRAMQPGRRDPSRFPADLAGSVVTVFWQGFQLDAVKVPEEVDGVAMISCKVQIPLKQEAIQLRVSGPHEQAEQLQHLTEDLLGNLRGKSNWVQTGAVAPTAESSGLSYSLLAFSINAIAIGLTALWFLRLYTPRGVVLQVSIGILTVSWGLRRLFVVEMLRPGEGPRQLPVVIATIALLGVFGCLLGAYDLCLKRSPK